jgi:Laminin G domain
VTDNEWHVIQVTQPDTKVFYLSIDDEPAGKLASPFSKNTLELTNPFYLGGLPQDEPIPVGLTGTDPPTHFAGCLASLSLGDNMFNLATVSRHSSAIIDIGCIGE